MTHQELILPFLNQVTLAGRLAEDPHKTSGSNAHRTAAAFTVVVTKRVHGGVENIHVECVAIGDLSTSIIRRCKKGSAVLCTGGLAVSGKGRDAKLHVAVANVQYLSAPAADAESDCVPEAADESR